MAEAIPGDKSADLLRKALVRIRRRQVLSGFLQVLSVDLLVGLSAFAAYLLMDRLIGLWAHEWTALGAALGAALLSTAVRAVLLLRLSLFDAALAADDRLRLKERVSSALYLSADPDPLRDPAWGELIRRDGERSLERADIPRSFPLRLPRAARWVLAPAALSVLLALLPPVDLLGIQKSRLADSAMRREVGRKKDELSKELEKLRRDSMKTPDPEIEKALEALRKRAGEEKEAREEERPPSGEEIKRNALVEFTRLEEALKKSLDA